MTSTRATFTPAEAEPIALCAQHWAPTVQAWRQASDIARKRNSEYGRTDYYSLDWVVDRVRERIQSLGREAS